MSDSSLSETQLVSCFFIVRYVPSSNKDTEKRWLPLKGTWSPTLPWALSSLACPDVAGVPVRPELPASHLATTPFLLWVNLPDLQLAGWQDICVLLENAQLILLQICNRSLPKICSWPGRTLHLGVVVYRSQLGSWPRLPSETVSDKTKQNQENDEYSAENRISMERKHTY